MGTPPAQEARAGGFRVGQAWLRTGLPQALTADLTKSCRTVATGYNLIPLKAGDASRLPAAQPRPASGPKSCQSPSPDLRAPDNPSTGASHALNRQT